MLFLAVFFLLSCATNSDVIYNGENRYIDRSAGFSICPPEFWQVVEVAGLKNKVLAGPQENNFTPNINFMEEKINGELKQYIDLNIPEIQKLFADFRLIRRSNFRTENNATGEKLLYTFTQNGILVRMAQYFIPGRNGVYMIISCGSPGSVGDKYDVLYDKTAETFVWTR